MNITLPVTPTKKQFMLLDCPADEILYGGALGGGKTKGAAILAFKLGM